MNRICRGCGEPFHTERDFENQCSDCDRKDREDRAAQVNTRVDFLKQMIFQTVIELQKKFNVVLYYYGYVDRLKVDVQPKEMKFEPPYMITTHVYCDGPNAEQELTLMLEELKSCLKL